MKNYTKRMIACAAACAISLTMVTSSNAVANQSEAAEAVAYLKEHQIMNGDQNGNMLLDQGLTRAQMAVMLSKIMVNPEHLEIERDYYAKQCHFTDVPKWARPYVGFCVSNHLVSGYDTGLYGADDPVTPAQACTVMLHCLEDVEREWNYQTACEAAVEEGIAPVEATAGKTISRGNMAILIYRTMLKMTGQNTSDPTQHNEYSTPHKGIIHCDDGSDYTVTDVSRYGTNVFADGPVGDLPTPTCDWSLFPAVSFPAYEARRFNEPGQDMLFVRNPFETKRMLYTVYNALGKEPSAWSDNRLLASISLVIPAELEPYSGSFWPWHESDLTNLVSSRPNSQYYLEAWDYYLNGVFQYTQYQVVSM